MEILLLAAVAENGIIGRGNGLPWRLRSDLAHFRALTMGKPVIMGRKTYQSIGRALPGRTTIVISRDPAFAAPGITAAPNLATALSVAHGEALRRNTDTIAIAGGAEIYAQSMALATRLAITHVHRHVEGDVHFPAIDPGSWHEVARTEHQPGAGDDASFTYAVYERIRQGRSSA